MSKRILSVVLVAGVILLMSSFAFAATVQIRSGSQSGEGSKDTNGSWIARGSLVQIINGSSIVPNSPGTINPGAGSSLITSSVVGQGYLGDPLGRFTISITVNANDVIYVRVWNGTDWASSTRYGNSALITVPANVAPTGAYFDIGAAAWNTAGPNIVCITTNQTPAVPGPSISVNSPTFSAVQGSNPSPNTATVTISNTGTAALTRWDAGAIAYSAGQTGWTSISKNFGTNVAAGASDSFTVTIGNVTAFTAGTYTATIPLTFSQGLAAQNVTITLTITPPNQPTVTGIIPASGAPGQTLDVTISGSNTTWNGNMLAAVSFEGTGIRVNSANATTVTTIVANITIDPNAAAVAHNVTVTGAAGSATFTVGAAPPPTTSILIDDFEGTEVSKTPVAGNAIGGYYAPFGGSLPIRTFATTPVVDGTSSMKVVYSWGGGDPAVNWGGGWGGALNTNKNLSGMNKITYRIYGEPTLGSATYRIQIVVPDGTPDGKAYRSSNKNIPAATGWTTEEVAFTELWNDADNSGAQNGTEETFANAANKTISGYNFVYDGKNTTAITTAHYIDTIKAEVSNVVPGPVIASIAPSPTGPGTVVTITGSNLGDGGVIMIEGQGVSSFISSVGSPEGAPIVLAVRAKAASKVTSWSADKITFKLPNMDAGTKNVKVAVGSTGKESNVVTFEVTAVPPSSGTSYNYPNPFNPLRGEPTTISFTPGSLMAANIYIFDMTARQISKLSWTQTAAVGTNGQVVWDGKNTNGDIVGDGVYLYRIVDTGNKLVSKGKILVINK